jgi:hypothetical protein
MGLWDKLSDPKNKKKVAWAFAGTGVLSAGVALLVDNYGLNPLGWELNNFSLGNAKAASIKLVTSPLYRYGAFAYIEGIAKSPAVDYVAKGLERIVDADMGKIASSSVIFGMSLGYKLAEYALLRTAGAENPEHLLAYSLAWSSGLAVLGPMLRDQRSIPQQLKTGADALLDRLGHYGQGIQTMPMAELPVYECEKQIDEK